MDGDTITGELTRAAGENVGSYAISQGTLTAGDNYTITFTGAELTIEKAAITIMAADKSSQYGKDIVELTYAVGGTYKTGDDLGVTVNTTATKTSDVGEYPITVSWNEDPNYTATLVNGKYTVTKTDLTVSATGHSGVYDGAAHGITVEVDASGATVYYAETELTADNYDTAGSTKAITRTDAGTTTVYYYVEGRNYDAVSGSKTVVITPATGTADETKGETPTARSGLAAFNDEPQELVTAPEKLPEGYDKVQYSLDSGKTWTDEIPTASKAGDYTVYVKYVGDNNHTDIEIDPIPVTVKTVWTVTFDIGDAESDVDTQRIVSGEQAEEPTQPTRDGYKFAGWYTDAECTNGFDFDDEIKESLTLFARWTAVGIVLADVSGAEEGATLIWTEGEDLVLTYKFSEGEDTSFRHFQTFRLDGEELTPGEDYTAREGSTVVTIPAEKLETLAAGTYSLAAVFDNGTVNTKLTIAAQPEPTATPKQPDTPRTPKTGDESHPALWLLLMSMSLFGLGVVLRTDKKRRQTKTKR